MHSLTQYCKIKNGKILLGGRTLLQVPTDSFRDLSDAFYAAFNTGYSKFHKMDNLCKLGFMAADMLLDNNKLTDKYNPFDIGVILENKSSSLDTDIRHHHQAQTGPASPAVFVYSLPNIVIGEICIRHGIKGENTFFINQQYDIPSQVNYITQLLNTNVVKVAIGGRVELLGDNYEAFLYLVEPVLNQKAPFTSEQITKLYHTTNE